MTSMASALLASTSPQDPTDVVVEFAPVSPEEVDARARTARLAQREWVSMPAPARAAALDDVAGRLAAHAEELTSLMVREVGKPVGEARGEAARSLAIVRYYAQQVLDPDGETLPSPDGRSLLMARRAPRGVAGLITPWNFPAAIPLWKAAPALAYGNAVLLKPAPAATGVAQLLERIVGDALPMGLFQVLAGGADTAQAIISRVDAVSFTGSVGVGGSIVEATARRGIPAQCEMGGQNASIVLPDADLERAAATIAGAAMGYAGQKCTATSRVIVVGDHRAVEEALVTAAEALVVGDPARDDVQVGPVISRSARDAVVAAADHVRRSGGSVLCGGSPLDRTGHFVGPTIVSGIGPDHPVAQQEVFGPICSLFQAADVDDALALANGTPYGLVSAVFTRDLDVALRAADQLEAGLVRINAATSGVDFYAPFGGEKASSYGPREQGKAARDFYTRSRTITVSPWR